MTDEEIKKIFKSKWEHCNLHKIYEEAVNMEIEALKREMNLKEDNAYREMILRNIIDKGRK